MTCLRNSNGNVGIVCQAYLFQSLVACIFAVFFTMFYIKAMVFTKSAKEFGSRELHWFLKCKYMYQTPVNDKTTRWTLCQCVTNATEWITHINCICSYWYSISHWTTEILFSHKEHIHVWKVAQGMIWKPPNFTVSQNSEEKLLRWLQSAWVSKRCNKLKLYSGNYLLTYKLSSGNKCISEQLIVTNIIIVIIMIV